MLSFNLPITYISHTIFLIDSSLFSLYSILEVPFSLSSLVNCTSEQIFAKDTLYTHIHTHFSVLIIIGAIKCNSAYWYV